ncbi:MAG: hypothetical protein DHS20C18_08480 [Saprospiraceae bacterium]|nr:MAG: hypothetical protein DHS20C18_08480 [Saprospiraceae bacterium]
MHRLTFFLFFITIFGKLWAVNIETVRVQFYSEAITLSYSTDMVLNKRVTVKEEEMLAYYKALEGTNYQVLLNALNENKINHQLNDWLYFELMRKALHQIMTDNPPLTVELMSWFLLSKAGFDTRLTYIKNKAFVYACTEDDVFEVPMIEENGKTFVNLSNIEQKTNAKQALYMLNFIPNSAGRSFSFYLKQLPWLKVQPDNKYFVFQCRNQKYELKVTIDRTIKDIMRAYPIISEKEYMEVPLSATIRNSLIPQLKTFLREKTEREALELLVAFTRSSFQYKEDKEYFGRSKPMIADEVFHYPYSDCEDRSALFFRLVKELLDLPMIIVAYPDHLTIGVAMQQASGSAVRYKDKLYFICDPTGPVNSAEIGEIPNGYENVPFEIIGSYK